MLDISQSQINLFRQCPYAYALRYIHKKEAIMWDPSIVEVGSRVHQAIEDYYKCSIIGKNKEGIFEKVYQILRNDWDTTLPASFLKKAYVCLEHFAEFEMNNINKGREVLPMSEVDIRCNGLRGIIDYLDLSNNKLIDFKTNTRAGIGYANKMQAVMYGILVKEKFNYDIPYFTLQFLYPGETRIIKYDSKLDKVREQLYDYVEQIQESWRRQHFPKLPRTKSTCNNCNYRFYCDGV